VFRFLVMEVGVASTIADDGTVNIDDNPAGVPDETREYDDGNIPVWYECPLCHEEIDMESEGPLQCDCCQREIPRGEEIRCCGYDEDDPDGCQVVACGDCAGLVFDDSRCCEGCRHDEDDGDDHEE